MRKLGKVAAVLVVLAILIGVAAFLALRGKSGGQLATWIGRQIVGVTASYIEPTIDFSTIDYAAPYSVTLHDVRLTAKDGTQVVAVKLVNVELAELPSMGKPIQIKSITLDAPALNLVKTATGFKGLVPFVKALPGKSDQGVDPNYKLSNVLRLRVMRMNNGSVVYDQADGSPKMVLDGLTLNLDVQPGTGADAGWYGVKTSMGRAPHAVIDVDGSVNIDTMLARFRNVALTVKVGPDSVGGLPPQIQTLVKEHDATGDLKFSASGEASLLDPVQGKMDVAVDLSKFNVAFGNFKLPIDTAQVKGKLAGGVFTLTPSGANLLKGTAKFDGTVGVGQPGQPASLNWSVANIDMRETLRVQAPQGAPPMYAGIVSGGGSVKTSIADPTGAISGNGSIALREGRLTGLPLMQQLAQATDLLGRVSSSLRMDHSADVVFTLEPRGMNISSLEVQTEFIGVKGDGIIGFDQTLDLTVSAGPMEKLSGIFGKNQVTKLIGDISGSLVKYRVGGKIGEPTVKVDPLGLRGK